MIPAAARQHQPARRPAVRVTPDPARAGASIAFRDAAEAWFWTMAALVARREASPRGVDGAGPPRPAMPEDILRCLDTLYRRRRIDLVHARILRIWGERGIAPDPGRAGERCDAQIGAKRWTGWNGRCASRASSRPDESSRAGAEGAAPSPAAFDQLELARPHSSDAAFLLSRAAGDPMAFTVRNLSVLAYAQGFTLWHYTAKEDGIADVAAPGFFEEASDMLASGDMLLASASDGGRVLFAGLHRGALRTTPLG